MNPNILEVKVAEKKLVAHDIIAFELVKTDGKPLPEFSAGSHIDVHFDNGIARQYSLYNSPTERHRYCLGILKSADSKGGSIAMHEKVNAGDIIRISHPRNSFHLDESANFSLLLAGGIGVTPLMCMAQRLYEIGANFKMHYCTRNRERTAFYDLLSLSPFAEHIAFHFDDGSKDQLLNLPEILGEYSEGSNLYVCGPEGFMEAVIQNAEKAWPTNKVHREYFSADPKAGHDDDQSFTVKIASSGKEYDIPGDNTIVEVLQKEGINIPVSCEQGICGACLTDVVNGTPDHRDMFLTDDEKNANDQMTPCCSRAKTDVIELDL